MDIKVITRHAPSNYGSLLQAIATQTILERLGYRCEIIDYVRSDEQGFRGVITALNGKKKWKDNFFKKLFYIGLRYPDEKIAEVKFRKMRSGYLNLTERCSTLDGLSKLDADIFMTGSDQVWGLTLNGCYDEAYFLTFVKDRPKVAYAASFGRTDFAPSFICDYRRMLSSYSAISVREDSAVDMLKEWDIACAGQVLDPTLMLTADDWGRYSANTAGENKKYVLVYQIHNDRRLGCYAKRFANHVGLPLVRVSPSLHQISREGKLKLLPGLAQFLSYIKNCTYLITDSFHGTAFALNFGRLFMEILPNNKTDSRNMSILNLTGLTNRIVTNFDDFTISEQGIDYHRVNTVLDRERQKSMVILEDIIRDCIN